MTSTPRFISLRWRVLLPLIGVLLVTAMLAAYALGSSLNASLGLPMLNLLTEQGRAVNLRAAQLYESDRAEAQRIAFTAGVADSISGGVSPALQAALQTMAQLAGLDSLILTDAQGIEQVGLTRSAAEADYLPSAAADLGGERIIRRALGGEVGPSGLIQAGEGGLLLYTAAPILRDGGPVGVVLVGRRLESVLARLRPGELYQLTLYSAPGAPLHSTFDAGLSAAPPLQLSPEQLSLATRSGGSPVAPLDLNGVSYQTIGFPFIYGSDTLAVASLAALDQSPLLLDMNRKLVGLTFAGVAAALVIGAFMVLNRLVIGRAEQITQTAQSLTAGQTLARTRMQATDELGAAGLALDQYAEHVQQRVDNLHLTLRRQRRETEHLQAALEAMPEGVIVQDKDGQVLVMNRPARQLISTQQNGRSAALAQLLTGAGGQAISPGLYTLGDPQDIDQDGRVLRAQAGAITDVGGERVGTVIVLRDITADVRRDQQREARLRQIETDIQAPLAASAHRMDEQPLNTISRELSKRAVALQKLVVELRDLQLADGAVIHDEQRPLPLETLVWSIANEWRQVATAAELTLDVLIERKGMFVLGDERRLRWAIGNLLDNAIKYTLPGGKLTLEIQGEHNGQATLRVRDNGVGILPTDLPLAGTRFYRGTPTTLDGTVLHLPGAGQGLYTARQIIEAHGGLFKLKSQQGIGTAVYFTLPLTAPVSYELPTLPDDLDGETMPLGKQSIVHSR
jgi:signal transduction histidine kinase